MFESIVNNKNSFYKIKKEEIIKAEERMKIKIPLELKKFYEQVGIGFIYSKEKAINRIIASEECADIRLREDVYEYDPDLELYEEFEEAAMIFFEINEGVYASIELNNNETNKIFFADKVIANSLEEFLVKTEDSNYWNHQQYHEINLIARKTSNEDLYYLYNGHADVTMLVNKAGDIKATYYYDAFGEVLESTGNVENSIRYAGYQYDEETGLYYLNARMLDFAE